VLDDTRNQPVAALPCFDHGRVSSFPPVHADRRHLRESGLLSATDGALIEWRREEVEGSVQGAGAIILFEVLEVSPRLNPSPLREPAAMEIYVGVSRRNLFRPQAKNNPLAKITSPCRQIMRQMILIF
jgi:hypothetical protein